MGLAAGTAGDIRPLELDVLRQESTNAAVAAVLAEQPALDVVVHNAGHVLAHEAGVVTPFTDSNRRTEHA